MSFSLSLVKIHLSNFESHTNGVKRLHFVNHFQETKKWKELANVFVDLFQFTLFVIFQVMFSCKEEATISNLCNKII